MNKERIKEHFKKHCVVYSAIGGAVLAGITMVVVRGRYETLVSNGVYGSKTADTSITMRPLSFLASQRNVVNVIARNGRGHPGYLVYCKELNGYFRSQQEIADLLAISPTVVSKHIAGKIPDAQGYHLERVKFSA